MQKSKILRSQIVGKYLFSTLALIPFTESFCADTIRVNKLIEGISSEYISPVFIDSVNLKNEKFKTESLINNYISDNHFSEKIITADTCGTFVFDRNGSDTKIYNHKFYIRSDKYANVDLDFKSNGIAAVFIDGEKKATDTKLTDSISKASFTTASITMEPGQKEVVIKTLSTPENKQNPSLIVNIIANKKGENAVIELSTSDKHPVTVEDMMIGDFFTSLAISSDGRYLLTGVKSVDPTGDTSYETYITDVRSGSKRHVNKAWKNLRWMPQSPLLMYMTKEKGQNCIRTFNPQTYEDRLLATNVPDFSYSINKDESYLVFNISDSDNKAQSGDIRRVLSPSERSRNSLSSNNIFIYNLKSSELKQATFGYHYLQPRSVGSSTDKIYFSQNGNCITERPFTNTSLLSLDPKTFQTDTIFYQNKFAGSTSITPDSKEILLIGSADAFDRLVVQAASVELQNYFDRTLYLLTISA